VRQLLGQDRPVCDPRVCDLRAAGSWMRKRTSLQTRGSPSFGSCAVLFGQWLYPLLLPRKFSTPPSGQDEFSRVSCGAAPPCRYHTPAKHARPLEHSAGAGAGVCGGRIACIAPFSQLQSAHQTLASFFRCDSGFRVLAAAAATRLGCHFLSMRLMRSDPGRWMQWQRSVRPSRQMSSTTTEPGRPASNAQAPQFLRGPFDTESSSIVPHRTAGAPTSLGLPSGLTRSQISRSTVPRTPFDGKDHGVLRKIAVSRQTRLGPIKIAGEPTLFSPSKHPPLDHPRARVCTRPTRGPEEKWLLPT